MSVNTLFNPNDFNLFCNSITANSVVSQINQIFWNSYDTLVSGWFIGPGTELPTYIETFAVAGNNITFSKLSCSVNPAPGPGNSWIFTFYQNGSPTSLVTTVSDTNTYASGSGSISLIESDTFAIGVTSTGSPSASTQAAVTLSYN